MNDRKRSGGKILFLPTALLALSCLCVSGPRPPLAFSEDPLPAGHVGQPYQAWIRILNAETPPVEFILSEGDLPKGLTIRKGEAAGGPKEYEAVIEGVPERAGTFTFTVWVSCYGTMVNGQTGSQVYTILIEE